MVRASLTAQIPSAYRIAGPFGTLGSGASSDESKAYAVSKVAIGQAYEFGVEGCEEVVR